MSTAKDSIGVTDRVFIEITRMPEGGWPQEPEAPPVEAAAPAEPALESSWTGVITNNDVKDDAVQGTIREVKLTYNPEPHSRRVQIATPSTGLVRMEFSCAMEFLTKPVNWYSVRSSPIRHQVAEARNECVALALHSKMDWVVFFDHDVLPPHDALLRLQRHMMRLDVPVVSGLYYTKSNFPEPLVFRGRGNGPYYDWEPGDEVWCDGIPMGIVMISTTLFRAMQPPWFHSPRRVLDVTGSEDPFPGAGIVGGTEDLYWADRVLQEDTIAKAGWKVPDPKNPFLVDTSILCQHITNDDLGMKYPECTGTRYLDDHKQARASLARLREAEAAAA